MDEFITLDEARDHLRIDTTDDDNDLRLKIQGASSAVMRYLKTRRALWLAEEDSNGDPMLDSNGWPVPLIGSDGQTVINPVIKSATLLMTGYLYRNRSDNEGAAFQQGFLPMPVTALLYPLRDPTVK